LNPRLPAPDEVARFQAIAVPHTDAAYNLALRLTRQAEAAEDVTHDAFVSALAGFAAYRGGDARAWILTIVRRKAYDWLRARARGRLVPLSAAAMADGENELEFDMPDPDQESPEQALIRKGEAAGVRAALDMLSPKLREVLVLREMEELSYREIAEVTATPIGSVMSRLARARGQLAEAWRRLQAPEESQA
jgi:RNA polymerase sigma-70 factor (ECF subfamily)